MLKEILTAIGIVAVTYSPLYDINYQLTMPDYKKETTLVSVHRWNTVERWKKQKQGIVQEYREYINGKIGDYRYWVSFRICEGEIDKPYLVHDYKIGTTYLDKDLDGVVDKEMKDYKGAFDELAPECQKGGE